MTSPFSTDTGHGFTRVRFKVNTLVTTTVSVRYDGTPVEPLVRNGDLIGYAEPDVSTAWHHTSSSMNQVTFSVDGVTMHDELVYPHDVYSPGGTHNVTANGLNIQIGENTV